MNLLQFKQYTTQICIAMIKSHEMLDDKWQRKKHSIKQFIHRWLWSLMQYKIQNKYLIVILSPHFFIILIIMRMSTHMWLIWYLTKYLLWKGLWYLLHCICCGDTIHIGMVLLVWWWVDFLYIYFINKISLMIVCTVWCVCTLYKRILL